jgi:hypothetical protein
LRNPEGNLINTFTGEPRLGTDNGNNGTPADWTKRDPHELLKAIQAVRAEIEELVGLAQCVVNAGEEIEKKVDGLLNLAELADPLVKDAMALSHGDDGRKWLALDVLPDGRCEVTKRSYSTRNALREWATVEALNEDANSGMVTLYWPSDVPLPPWAQECPGTEAGQ